MIPEERQKLLEEKTQPLREELEKIQSKIELIQSKAQAESRDLTDDEDDHITRLLNRFDTVESAIKELELTYTSRGRQTDPYGPNDRPHVPFARDEDVRFPRRGAAARGRPLFRDMNTQRPVMAFRRGEAMSSIGDGDEPLVGSMIRAMILGEEMPGQIRNAVSTSGDGASIVPTIISSRLIDMARSASVCVAAGAESISVDGETKIGIIANDPTAYWRGELQSITSSSITFSSITISPKVVGVLIPVSVEWLEDSVGGLQAIETAVSGVLGAALDKAGLMGAGGTEPTGILNATGVNARTSFGAPSNYDGVTNAVGDILAANYNGQIENLSWVYNPATAVRYQKLTTGITNDKTPLQAPEWVSKLRRHTTTSIPVNGGVSPHSTSMFVGDFSQMVFGFRMGGMRFQVFDQGTARDLSSSPERDINAMSDLAYWIRGYIRVDVGLLRPKWFTRCTGVTGIA